MQQTELWAVASQGLLLQEAEVRSQSWAVKVAALLSDAGILATRLNEPSTQKF